MEEWTYRIDFCGLFSVLPWIYHHHSYDRWSRAQPYEGMGKWKGKEKWFWLLHSSFWPPGYSQGEGVLTKMYITSQKAISAIRQTGKYQSALIQNKITETKKSNQPGQNRNDGSLHVVPWFVKEPISERVNTKSKIGRCKGRKRERERRMKYHRSQWNEKQMAN